jgi:hypothetical protein
VGVTPLLLRDTAPRKQRDTTYRFSTGTTQFKPLAGSIEGETGLCQLPSDEVTYSAPGDEEALVAVIEAIFESHPYEEPLILAEYTLQIRVRRRQPQ